MNKLLLFAFLLAVTPAGATLYPMQDNTTAMCFLQDLRVDRVLMPVPIPLIAELCTMDQSAGDVWPGWYDADTATVVRGHWEFSVFVKESPLPAERWQYMGRGGFLK